MKAPASMFEVETLRLNRRYVVEVVDPKRVTIMFKDGLRTLAHGQD